MRSRFASKFGSGLFVLWLVTATGVPAAEIARGPAFSVIELSFAGPVQQPTDVPARDVDFHVRFRHESGGPEYTVSGFWDGDGRGGMAGDAFKVRFCPTAPGRWILAQVTSNAGQLAGQKQGDFITADPSERHGFWVPDEDSPGRRWFRRSDGSHQYVVGNTHYSFLSGYRAGGRPSGNDIAADIAANARYFKKLRFGLTGDRYPHPDEKPFLDDAGRPTDSGDFSHRPNPRWFSQRVDTAVRAALEHDLIADLILAGPDAEDSRATLRARHNNGDPTPYLRYVAARYGSFPNVWLCLSNEFNIKRPNWEPGEIARFGETIGKHRPYPTPLSVHPNSPTLWDPAFDRLSEWHTHHIIQRKIRDLGTAADVLASVAGDANGRPRNKPTVNDELSYQGAGDRHSEHDTIEAHLGAFLGGGYGTTGWKPGNKLGHYFWGRFDAEEHTAADNLGWLRETIDREITFWKMSPDASIFENLGDGFRGMAWADNAYVLGTNAARSRVVANLPEGRWTVRRHDVIGKQSETLSESAAGRFAFDAPDSRAVLFHFRKNGRVSRRDNRE